MTKPTIRFVVLCALVNFIFCSPLFAINIPQEFRDFLLKKNRADLIKKIESIPNLTPDQFVDQAQLTDIKMAGAGFNGVAFKDRQGRIIKILHKVLAPEGKLKPEQSLRSNWAKLFAMPYFTKLTIPLYSTEHFGKFVNENANEKEVLGTLLWAIYDARAEKLLPDLWSADGAALRRSYVPGEPLDKVLNGKSNIHYNLNKVWQKIIELQDLGERMLLDCGVMVDFLNPSNFLVTGSSENPEIELVDHELIKPSAQAKEYYASLGKPLPDYQLTNNFDFVYWPLMPDHIVLSNIWKLSFDQAVLYIKTRYKLSEKKAIRKLSQIPKWNIFIEGQSNYQHIENAQRAVAIADRFSHLAEQCSKLLAMPLLPAAPTK